jgi:hypothetical protein
MICGWVVVLAAGTPAKWFRVPLLIGSVLDLS